MKIVIIDSQQHQPLVNNNTKDIAEDDPKIISTCGIQFMSYLFFLLESAAVAYMAKMMID